MDINPYFPRLFVHFSKTVVAAQWILNQLESSTNLQYRILAIWSGFFNSCSYSTLFEQSSNFKSNSTVLKILQSTLKFVWISQFVCVFIFRQRFISTSFFISAQRFHCGKLVSIFMVYHIFTDNSYKLPIMFSFFCHI